jgi:TolA-binding protein
MSTSCPQDLLGVRRPGQLSSEEVALLEQHLQSCTACALFASLHDDFAKVGHPRAADEQLMARAVQGAFSARTRRVPRARRSWTLAAAAGLALVITGGLASAGIWIYRATRTPAAPTVAPDRPTPRTAQPQPRAPEAVAPAATPAESAAPVAEQPNAPPPARALGRAHAVHRRVAAVEDPPAAAPLDLATLFASANQARRAGQAERAGELYVELQRRFPESREALLSLVSYGRILLDRGQPEQALAQFERHIQAASGGVLFADALYGKARALTALHRAADARRCWNELLSRFPDSIYADTARAQLGQGTGAKP